LKGIYDEKFIASNQKSRANHILENYTKYQQVNLIREDIKKFKKENNLDKVIVFWSGNTERYVNIDNNVHSTSDNLLKALENNHHELSPSILYGIAAILEGCS